MSTYAAALTDAVETHAAASKCGDNHVKKNFALYLSALQKKRHSGQLLSISPALFFSLSHVLLSITHILLVLANASRSLKSVFAEISHEKIGATNDSILREHRRICGRFPMGAAAGTGAAAAARGKLPVTLHNTVTVNAGIVQNHLGIDDRRRAWRPSVRPHHANLVSWEPKEIKLNKQAIVKGKERKRKKNNE